MTSATQGRANVLRAPWTAWARAFVLACLVVAMGAVGGCSDTFERVVVMPGGASTAADGGGARGDGGVGDLDGGRMNASRPDGGPDAEPVCGNGTPEGDQECDDGNRRGGDGCNLRCQLESCGNGQRDRYEGCDDGNRTNGDGCDWRCQREPAPPACGNGEIDGDEACDDGNLEAGDGCDDMCLREQCGDGRVSAGEACDPPATGVCTSDCQWQFPNCGDGQVQPDEHEQCDDANDVAGDGCDRCRLECGNGVITPAYGEECEPPGSTTGRPCDEQCRWRAACGDGIFQPEAGEACDASSTEPAPAGFVCDQCALHEQEDPTPDGGVDAGVPPPCVVTHRSIVPDSGFDDGVGAWLPATRVSVSHEMSDGALERGSLRMEFAAPANATATQTGLEVSRASRCVSVTPGHEYHFRSFVRGVAPVPTGAVASLRARGFENADCSGAPPSANLAADGSLTLSAEGWHAFDTAIQTLATTRTVLVELLLIKPRNRTVIALWDDLRIVSMDTDPGCGDCVLDEAAGESCDDGNRVPRDGCDMVCQRQPDGCGDGFQSGNEACDEGSVLWSDSETCTPACRLKDACDACIEERCTEQLGGSLGLEGSAEAGPGAGRRYAVIAEELRACVHRTGCAAATHAAALSQYSDKGGALENCYCGSALDERCYVQGVADGLCRAEVEAAVETRLAPEVWTRFGGGAFPLAGAIAQLLWCEGNTGGQDGSCSAECRAPSSCGDSVLQDRTAEDGAALCDALWSEDACPFFFEQCDDGGDQDGDGCDANCFVEACGNGISQPGSGEECDDGNEVAGDGCSPTCVREFTCGNGVLEPPFEACDVPGAENPTKVCTPDELQANASQCRCDPRTCQRVVCGDGEIGDGEQCEPPGEGSCDASCQRPEDPCLSCSRAIAYNPDVVGRDSCGPELFLDGVFPGGGPLPQGLEYYAGGCLAQSPCFELLSCWLESGCFYRGGLVECACGQLTQAECFSLVEGAPGVCYEPAVRAFEAQYGGPPVSLEELVSRFTPGEGIPGAFAQTNAALTFHSSCLGGQNGLLVGQLITESVIERECPPAPEVCAPTIIEAAEQQGRECELTCFPFLQE
jgi:cysteine-rich repeat protein